MATSAWRARAAALTRPARSQLAEDDVLAARWLAGPGARPTLEDEQRLVDASAAGRLPRRQLRQIPAG